MFNSREYQWSDVTVIAGGQDLTKIRGIKIMSKVDREPVYAKGSEPHSIQSGNNEHTGELKVLQSQLHALQKSGGGSILPLSIDVLCAFGNPAAGDAIVTKRAIGARFLEEAEEMNQGDKFAEITLPFVCLRWQTV